MSFRFFFLLSTRQVQFPPTPHSCGEARAKCRSSFRRSLTTRVSNGLRFKALAHSRPHTLRSSLVFVLFKYLFQCRLSVVPTPVRPHFGVGLLVGLVAIEPFVTPLLVPRASALPMSRATVWEPLFVQVSPGPCGKRAQHFAWFSPRLALFSAAAALPRHGAPSRGRLQWLASWCALHACLAGYAPFLPGQILRPVSWAAFQRAPSPWLVGSSPVQAYPLLSSDRLLHYRPWFDWLGGQFLLMCLTERYQEAGMNA
jgi:hypothetical protein